MSRAESEIPNMKQYDHVTIPAKGKGITVKKGTLVTPPHPIIPFIEGEGIGPDIMAAAQKVLTAAISHAYGKNRSLMWMEVYVGEKAQTLYKEPLPQETLDVIRNFRVALKGPLGTPIGGGHRSFNVALRQLLDLYACIRPVRYFEGVPSQIKDPSNINIVIFRENIEDVYAGWEWPAESLEAVRLIKILNTEFATSIRLDSGIGIKPISEFGTKRLVRKAVQYAIDHNRESVTLVHKGNIMKYTEGAFRDWGYEVAREEFAKETITENELWEKYGGKPPEGKIVIKDRIADNMFQQILLRPREYDVIAAPNLNGDYLSDAAAALVGGLGIAPGANIGDHAAIFEATHGTAPKYAGKNVANPTSLILSGAMMLEYLGWQEAADFLAQGLKTTLEQKQVTQDFARQMKDVPTLSTSEFADAIIENMRAS